MLTAPLVALIVVGGLALVLRWAFRNERTVDPFAPVDYGLLEEAAVVDSTAAGQALRAALGRAGIRATLAIQHDGRCRVLVFADQLDAARRVLG